MGALAMAESSDVAVMEALRPKSLQELHEAVAAGGRRKRLPPVVEQLRELCERRAECEERCVVRLRDRSMREAALLPPPAGRSRGSRPATNRGSQYRRQAFCRIGEPLLCALWKKVGAPRRWGRSGCPACR